MKMRKKSLCLLLSVLFLLPVLCCPAFAADTQVVALTETSCLKKARYMN